MELGRLLRLWLPPLLLSVFAFVAWQTANQSDFEEVAATAEPYELGVQTPLFSARRVPMSLVAPINDDAVEPAITRAMERADALSDGDRSCLIVQDGQRRIGPSEDPAGGLVPASNQKLLTTYGALGMLGTDFRFVTTVAASDQPANGVVTDLYLVGGGDPFLVTDDWIDQYDDPEGRYHTRLEDLADSVVAAGITEITGTLYGDESLLDSQRIVAAWHPRLISQKQSGPLSALSVNEGFVEWPEQNPEILRPRVETDNPPLHAATVFADLLRARNVTVAAEGVAVAPEDATKIAIVESPRLADIVTHINSFSSNFGAEMLLKRIGLEAAGVGSTAEGANALAAFLAERGIPTAGLTIVDGSGLAETDRVTCSALIAVLVDSGDESDFARSLSVVGERGSLSDRPVDPEVVGQVLAKTGTLQGVRSLSGFAESAVDDNTELAFSFIVNGRVLDDTTLDIQDSLLSALVAYPAGPPLESLVPLPAVPVGEG